MKMPAIELEKLYAGLTGITNIRVEVNPPFGDASRANLYGTFRFLSLENARGYLPKWAREWSSAGPLIGKHGLIVDADDMGLGLCVEVKWRSTLTGELRTVGELYADHPSKELAIMYAIVLAAAEHQNDLNESKKD